jgi:hypothetical protein
VVVDSEVLHMRLAGGKTQGLSGYGRSTVNVDGWADDRETIDGTREESRTSAGTVEAHSSEESFRWKRMEKATTKLTSPEMERVCFNAKINQPSSIEARG